MNPIAYQLNIIGALVSAILAVVFVLAIGESSWIPSVVAGVIYLLNIANKHPMFHSLIFYCTTIIAIFKDTLLFGLETNIHYSFITMIIVSFLIFPNNKAFRITALFITGIPFFSTIFFASWYMPSIQLDTTLISIVSGLFSGINFIVFLYMVSFFTSEKTTKEKELNEQLDTVTIQKGVIEKAQRESILANEELHQLYHKIQKQTILLKETQKLSKIGTWKLTVSNNTVFFSEEARVILKIDSSEFVAFEKWLNYFSNKDKLNLERFIYKLKNDYTPFEQEFLINIGEEECCIKIMGKAEVHDNQIIRIYGVIQDITQVYENEKLRNEKLDAENLASAKALFLAKMSHEIRTPINGVMGITHLMLKTDLSEKQMKYAKAIETSSDTLLMIVNDILDISKIESGKMTFEKKDFEIKELIHSVYEMFLNKVAERSISLVYHFQEGIKNKLLGDPTRLNQILYNLIGNAIKFTSHGQIEILLSGNKIENNILMTKIIVKDSGIGIEKNKLDHIFESFTQAESDTTRKYGGTGLGLSIVKQLVELQGGTINVRSEIGKGSEFEVLIPYEIQYEYNTNDSVNKEIVNVNKALIKGIKILLVEDNPINQMVIKDMLEAQGAIIHIANNGQEAVDTVKSNSDAFEIVLMDMQMPVMDGYEAMRNIREKLLISRENLPIIALTAHVMEGEMEKCMNSGANDYISKPFKPNDLYKKILTITHRM